MKRGWSRLRLGLAVLLAMGSAAATTDRFELPALPEWRDARTALHPQTGYLAFIGGDVTGGGAVLKSQVAQALDAGGAARYYLAQYARAFGASDAEAELVARTIRKTSAQRTTVRYQQHHQSVPVLGGELLVNLGPNNSLLSINGELSPLPELDPEPLLTAAEAHAAVRAALAKWRPDLSAATLSLSDSGLAIYDPRLLRNSELPAKLVWVVDAMAEAAAFHDQFFVDAHSGGILLRYSRIMHARDRLTHDAGGNDNLPGTLVCNEADDSCAAGDTDEKNAHRFARDTYEYYAANHGRDSFDDAGGSMISSVHFDDGACPNALWNGMQTAFCDGLVADDVVAHEWTHAVTQYESSLFYFDQSGAINESLSDIWGEVIDQLNGIGTDTDPVRWLQGEDAQGGAIRNMADPTQFGDPDQVGSPAYHLTFEDNFGVHINSGVNNKAAFLIADGGSFNGFTIAPLNADRATSLVNLTKLYYEAQASLLTSGASYRDLYEALQQACANLVGAGTSGFTAASCVEVRKALDAVEMNSEPTFDFYASAEPCPAGQAVTQTLFSSGFETLPQPWGTTTIAGFANNWEFAGDIAHRGLLSGAVSDADFASDSVLFTSAAIPALPANAWLYFHHIYATETDPFCDTTLCDGGVVEYSTDGVAWQDAGPLFSDGKDYDGPLATNTGNPLAQRSAFGGVSHVYVPTRYNLAGLAGENLRIRFRFASDSSVGFLGWSVDDVQVHVCAAAGDTTPSAFSFADQTDVPVSTIITSNAVAISGINAPAPVSVSGGEYSVGCTPVFTTGAGSISNGQTVCVRHASSGANSTAVDTVLTIGGVSDTFTSTTISSDPDSTPNPFSFTDQVNVPRATTATSEPITVTGINMPAGVSITGGEYSIGCNGVFTAAAGSASAGQTVCVRHTTAAGFSAVTNTVLTVGGVSDTFSSTTEAADTQPDAFSFTPETNVGPGSTRTSDAVTITGINGPAPISVVDGHYSIGCGSSFTNAAGQIANGQTVCVRHTAATAPLTVTTTVLSVGGASGTFTSLTRDLIPDDGEDDGDDDNESPGSAFRGESSGGGGCSAPARKTPFDPVWLLLLTAAVAGIRRRRTESGPAR